VAGSVAGNVAGGAKERLSDGWVVMKQTQAIAVPGDGAEGLVPQPCHLYGTGGHAFVVMDVIESLGWSVGQLFDDRPPVSFCYPSDQNWPVELGLCYPDFTRPAGPFLITIGDCQIRKAIAQQLQGPFATAISPTALVSPTAQIGAGTVVLQGATIQALAEIGQHVIINTRASIDHEVRIGDYAHISPMATLCGNVHVGEGSWIGAAAVVIPGVKIGKWATVGAGAVVIRDVPDGVTVVGNPGREKQRAASG